MKPYKRCHPNGEILWERNISMRTLGFVNYCSMQNIFGAPHPPTISPGPLAINNDWSLTATEKSNVKSSNQLLPQLWIQLP